MSTRPLPPQPSLEHLKKQAKALLAAHKGGDHEAASRFRGSLPPLSEASDTEVLQSKISLRDAQLVVAREYGFETWAELRGHITRLEKAGLQELEIDGIRTSIANYQRVVVLRAKKSDRYLPIWIGPAEADSIALKLQNISLPRPITHDLLDLTIADLGAKVTRVVVSDLRGDTFYATITLQLNGKTIERDSRPSDAIALAVRAGAPIFASEMVLEKAGKTMKAGESLELGGSKSDGKLGEVRGSLTERARDAISGARKHARRLNHDAVGSEHLLLGLVGETEDTAAKVLVRLDADLDKIAAAVESMLGPGKGVPGYEVPFTPRASRVLQSAGEVARELGHFWFGTEHLLLALMQEGGGQATGPLDLQGITLDKVKTETLRILEERGAGPRGGGAKKARPE